MSASAAALSVAEAIPMLDLDPFSDDFLADPYAYHPAMRDAGPVVRLAPYDIVAMARHQEVSAALNDWETFCSGRGAGLSDFAKEKPWRTPSLLLEADPPLHTRTRTVIARILSPGAMKMLRERFESVAEAMVAEIVARGECDLVADLAEPFPTKVFGDAVGLPLAGRENLVAYGNLAFNAFGPRNKRLEDALATAAPVVEWTLGNTARAALSKDGFGAQIYAAADAGDVSEEEAGLLVRSFLTAGVDTTVNGIANLMACFLAFPDQWRVLRERPSLVRGAFDEALRYQAPIQTFFRTTTKQVTVSGVSIEEGEKVLLFLASANRDPRRWADAERFDITRTATGHVAFGTGIHGCVGQMLARLELELVVNALLKRVARIEPVGPPQRKLNNSLFGWGHLPARLVPLS